MATAMAIGADIRDYSHCVRNVSSTPTCQIRYAVEAAKQVSAFSCHAFPIKGIRAKGKPVPQWNRILW